MKALACSLLLAVIAAAGCATPEPSAIDICDTANDLMASAAAECGLPYTANECDHVIGVATDPAVYLNECVPWWEASTCKQKQNPPAACHVTFRRWDPLF